MPIVNRVADLAGEITEWRHDLHAHPELMYDVNRTAASVAQKLKEFGCDEVVSGVGRTGVVGVIKGRKGTSNKTTGKVIGLRADMDALPIEEQNDLPYKSTVPGKMHACGHDGHTAMLLGAARYLAETRNFAGNAVVIFQPAEEGGAGGKAMVDDGLMSRFGIGEVYGMHNYPGMPVGAFGIRAGAVMAAADYITIDIEGLGAHAARPHKGIDTVLVAAQIIVAVQSVVSRNVDPLKSAVVSIPMVQAGSADNVIPQTVQLKGTVRTLEEEVRDHGGAAPARDRRAHGAGLRRQGQAHLPAQLPGAGQPRQADRLCRFRRQPDRRRCPRGHRSAADDGGGGFLLHAQRAPRRLHLGRQRRQCGPASPQIQFQRRDDPGRHVVLGEAGGDRARRLKAPGQFCSVETPRRRPTGNICKP